MRIAFILGTRPEIIKMSPIVRECLRCDVDFVIIHTGQHYSYEMDQVFFEELELPQASYNLRVGSGTHAQETGKMLMRVEEVLLQETPDVVLVLGDTNSVLAGALAAAKLHITVGHVEAGMRSYDRSMPEEINRIVVDHISDFLFACTGNAQASLLGEGISQDKIFVTGSTIVEAVSQHIEIASRRSVMKKEPQSYFLLTMHREESVDVPERLNGVLAGLGMIYDQFKLPVLWPAHPRARKRLREFGMALPNGVELTKSVGFLEFLQLEKNARLVLTDSGGVQMEACILHVPCVTLRHTTEWVETVELGANYLAGYDQRKIVAGAVEMLGRQRQWQNPFGDGTAATQTVEILAAASPR